MIGEIMAAPKRNCGVDQVHFKKPVVAFIAGQTAPRSGGWDTRSSSPGKGTAAEKWALTAAGEL